MAVWFCISLNSVWECPISKSPYGMISVLKSQPFWRAVISNCDYNLNFPNKYWRWASFYVLICHLFSDEVSVKMFFPFKKVVLFSYCWVVIILICILGTSPFPDMCFTSILSQPKACLLIFLTVYFEVLNFSEVQNRFFLLCFLLYCFLRNLHLIIVQKDFLMFYQKFYSFWF